MNIINDIDKRLNMDINANIFFDIYSFTTENINGYIPYFDLKNKSLLTVGSSADQIFNASLEGCNDITVCDICPLTKYYYYLKLSSLLLLNKEEYLKFLCQKYYDLEHNPYFLNKKTFYKIKNSLKLLDYDSYYIWDYLFNKYNNNQIEKLFRHDINIKEDIIHCNNYLKNNKYFKHLKNSIQKTNVNFINGDVTNYNYNRQFDNIWLSNIAHYLDGEGLVKLFLNNEKSLKENGKMLLCYYWNKNTLVGHHTIIEFDYIDNKDLIVIPGVTPYEDNSIILYNK